jgi:hypothetical protein
MRGWWRLPVWARVEARPVFWKEVHGQYLPNYSAGK